MGPKEKADRSVRRGPLAGPFESRFGTRAVIMVSGVLISLALVAASLATTLVQFGICLTVLSAPGHSFSSIISRGLVGRHYTTHYVVANGVGQSGHAVGLVVFAPLAQLFLDTYGWRGAMLLIAGISMHLVVCGALLNKRLSASYFPVPQVDTPVSDVEDMGCVSTSANAQSKITACCLKHKKTLGFDVLSKIKFWLTAAMFISIRLVSDLWVIYFVAHCQVKGFSGQEAVVFTAVSGVGNLVFTVGHGPIVAKGWIPLRPMMVILSAVAAGCLFIDPWMNVYWMMLVNAFIFQGTCGAFRSVVEVYTKDLMGAESLMSAFGWWGVLGAIFTLALGFFPGWLYDHTGSYDLAFILLGCIRTLPLVIMLLEWFLHRYGLISRDGEIERTKRVE